MAYTISILPSVQSYFRGLTGLTRLGRLKLLIGALRDHGDVLRSEPSRRLASGSSYFRFDFIFSDAGQLWRADCVADDSNAIYGVLHVVYLDCHPAQVGDP